MITPDVLIIGGGPAGLSAASASAACGARVLLLERDRNLGGQLVKQTHKFFGSEKQHASVRGIDIAKILTEEIASVPNVTAMTQTTGVGMYEDGMVTADHNGEYIKILPRAIIVATGASEKYLSFVNNDLPGVYGAGAVQTLMHVDGVRPGRRVLMMGAGNIGLIVSYQLLQAQVEVAAVIDAAPQIGGYRVHASKIRRLGVPIYTRRTIVKAHGVDRVTAATTIALDDNGQPISGTELDFEVDTICISVGLTPLIELLGQIGVDRVYVPELGGYTAKRNGTLMTSRPGVFVAGDAAGVEEASAAMVEGQLAGFAAAQWLGCKKDTIHDSIIDLERQLVELRSGPEGNRIRTGQKKVQMEITALDQNVESSRTHTDTITDLDTVGIPTAEEIQKINPSPERLQEGPVVIVECFREIPCNPCADACPQGAIHPFENIHHRPAVDHERCTGCGLCISHCPGLAIRVVDMTWSKSEALVRLPYEFLPHLAVGHEVELLGRDGRVLGSGRVVEFWDRPALDRTQIVAVAVNPEWALDTAAIRAVPQPDDEDTIICRCSDVSLSDLKEIIATGIESLDEIKRLTRIGMGPSQGKTCTLLAMREIARLTGKPLDSIPQPTDRPLSVGVRMKDIVRHAEEEDDA